MKVLKPDWPAPPHIKAGTTVKQGWIGRDQGESIESVLNLPEEPIWLNQVHGKVVVEALPENREKAADASFTSTPGRVCVSLTADCLPILITNQKGSHVAAIHAGWRGLAAGIVEETLTALSLPPEELLVWFGPAIGPKKFEVGQDVYDAFTQQIAETGKAFLPQPEGKWLGNLYELARIRLNLQGVTHIYGGDFCTHTQQDLFFSYRRDKGSKGRMASVIWIEY